MPRPKSQADVMADWEELLDAVQKNPDVLPSVEAERQSLTQSLTDVQTLKNRQNELRGLRQEVTQQLVTAIGQGRDTALKVRSVVKGKVGPKRTSSWSTSTSRLSASVRASRSRWWSRRPGERPKRIRDRPLPRPAGRPPSFETPGGACCEHAPPFFDPKA